MNPLLSIRSIINQHEQTPYSLLQKKSSAAFPASTSCAILSGSLAPPGTAFLVAAVNTITRSQEPGQGPRTRRTRGKRPGR